MPPSETGSTASTAAALHASHSGPHAQLPRTGIGYDSHRFAPGGPLILGGVEIPSDVRLAGHSDGDAVAHALTDAILGACGDGDIGTHFPDDDPANRGRSSIEMLAVAVSRAADRGFMVGNADITVIAEKPRIALYREAMREVLAPVLECSAISIKGKTNEGMGWVGRGEGLACIAVAMLFPRGAETGR